MLLNSTTFPTPTIFFPPTSPSTVQRANYLRSLPFSPSPVFLSLQILRCSLTDEILKVKELEDLPEQWRRSKVAWLCKELPSHKHSTLTRHLNAQRKWITQDDLTYVVVHCLRIRENETSFRVRKLIDIIFLPSTCSTKCLFEIHCFFFAVQVYSWMVRQHWFRFDFALATKLADCLGKDRKFSKCREVFDDINRNGRVPSESTFHTLVVAYLSAPVDGCLEEACAVYNRMIQFGGYRPLLSLHNSLFRALVNNGSGVSSKQFLVQAEFIYHNLVTSDLAVDKDVYVGLIWLHSYQDVVNMDRIGQLMEEMLSAGIPQSKDVLVSIIRAASKLSDVDEVEKTWKKLVELGTGIKPPATAFVYRMDVYGKINQPLRSLEIFRSMPDAGVPYNVVTYQKIIEVMTKALELEQAELLMAELMETGLKPLVPSFIALMDAYLKLGKHQNLESTFNICKSKCTTPNRTVYNLYLDSLIRTEKYEMAVELYDHMNINGAIGTNARSCNIMLGGSLAGQDYGKVEEIFETMRQKKYDVEEAYMEKLDYVLSLRKKKIARNSVSLKLDQEQREILIGLILAGGAQIETDYESHMRNNRSSSNNSIQFKFGHDNNLHSLLKVHIHERFHEWLTEAEQQQQSITGGDITPRNEFSTTNHSVFDFFEKQFWTKGRSRCIVVPKLIHRWVTERTLAYWYMYTGMRTSSGDVVLRVSAGKRECVERVVECFQMRRLDCKVKKKGKSHWIGLQGCNASKFLELIDPFMLVHDIQQTN